MHPDAWRMLWARILRNVAYGYLSVVLGIYLDLIGLGAVQIGLVLAATAAGSAVFTIIWSVAADRIGRRRSASVLCALMAAGGLTFATTSNPWLLIVAGFLGSVNAQGTDAGIFLSVDQSMLPQVAPDRQRTWIFAIQNFVGTLAVAAGSLGAGSVALFSELGLHGADAYRPLFFGFAVVGVLSLLLFASLSPAVEVRSVTRAAAFGLGPSRKLVLTLTALYALDSFAGGFVIQSITAYWFYLVWGLSGSDLGLVFFWTNILSAVSMLSAGWLARRFGLMNTMIMSHVPFNIFTALMPFAPTAGLAVVFCIARGAVGQAYLPSRLSYVMAIVQPEERSAAAGYTNLVRNVTGSFSPALSGVLISSGMLGAPFVLTGILKLVYDAFLYAMFHHVRPPEERLRESPEALTPSPHP